MRSLAILTALRAPAGTEVLLAGRDEQALAAAGKALPYQVKTLAFDATELDAHQALIDSAFDGGDVDLVISAAGVLHRQDTLDGDPLLRPQRNRSITWKRTSNGGRLYMPAGKAPST